MAKKRPSPKRKRKSNKNGSKKKKTNSKKRSKQVKCQSSLDLVRKNIKDDPCNFFDYGQPLIRSLHNNGSSAIDCLEPVELSPVNNPSFEPNSIISFDLNSSNWLTFNNDSRFLVTLGLERKKKDGEWEFAESTDLANLKFHPNFIRNLFSVSYFVNDLQVVINQNVDHVDAQIESYLLSVMDKSQRKRIFGTSKFDSSNFCFATSNEYIPSSEDTEYSRFLSEFTRKRNITCSFVPFQQLPWPNVANDEELYNLVLPQVADKRRSIRLRIDSTGSYSFYQTKKSSSVQYRLSVTNVKLILQRIRFTTFGFSLNVEKILRPKLTDFLKMPCSINEVYVENQVAGNDYLNKIWTNIAIPNRIFVFKVHPQFINNNNLYPSSDIYSWRSLQVDKMNVTVNELNLYDSSPSPIDCNDPIMSHFIMNQNKRSFINGFKFNPLATNESYFGMGTKWPHLEINFQLFDNKGTFINPIMAGKSSLDNSTKNKLEISLTFPNTPAPEAGSIIFYFFYEKHKVNFRTHNGNFFNPLVNACI